MCLLTLTPLRHRLSPFDSLLSAPASHLLQLQILNHDARSPREGSESRSSQTPLQQSEEQLEGHKVLARVTPILKPRPLLWAMTPNIHLDAALCLRWSWVLTTARDGSGGRKLQSPHWCPWGSVRVLAAAPGHSK